MGRWHVRVFASMTTLGVALALPAAATVPATGLERATRAFAAAVDRVNGMTMAQLRGANFPAETGQGTLTGTERLATPVVPSGL